VGGLKEGHEGATVREPHGGPLAVIFTTEERMNIEEKKGSKICKYGSEKWSTGCKEVY
jgi:hypothetical protein